ncbi:MAG: molybdopterin-dependent oxidoreductase, partial [Longimicrobiales bacterium]|nr:molybdopterin-dependent oxidoreductase [Longimicrobiales bacterium]
VRFMSEVEQDARLTVVERGSRSVIDTFFDEGLDGTHFHGNVVDICPVGALVSKDFLHKARAWDLTHTPSVCTSCSQGCNIEHHTRDNLIQRLKPRENLDVNGWWMCDYGRHNYEWMNHGDRLEAPVVRGGEPSGAMSWGDALRALLERAEALGGAKVKAVASPFASNESLGALKRLVDALGGGEIVYRSPRADDEVPLKGFPTLVRRKDLAPNTGGADLLGMTRVGDDEANGGLEGVARHDGIVIVLGDGLHDQGEDFGADAGLFVYLGTHGSEAVSNAHVVLPITSHAETEGTFTNYEGRVQRFWPSLEAPGMARPAWLILGALASELTEAGVARTAAESFSVLGGDIPAFSGITYDDIGTRGALVNESVSLTGD